MGLRIIKDIIKKNRLLYLIANRIKSILIDIKNNLQYHNIVNKAYRSLLKELHGRKYKYVMFVPWIIKGGGDKYSIEYANTIAALNKRKHVLVLSTVNVDSIWSNKLNDGVGFVNIEKILESKPLNIKFDSVQKLFNKLNISHIHIINSVFGYDFIEQKQKYILDSNIKVILTSFSLGVDIMGHPAGYSRTYVPRAHNIASFITSDNQAIIDDWVSQYGFSKHKMLLHRQPVSIDETAIIHKQNSPLRVLWASRISYEKQPELIAPICNQLPKEIVIDIYGSVEKNNNVFENLPENAKYMGPYDGFDSINLSKYDIFLYTSLFDGMPNVIIEAIQSGLPVIASSVGGIPELIIDNETGFLINNIKDPSSYASAIMKIAKNPNIGNRMAENALIKLQKEFNRDIYMESIKKMLEGVDYIKKTKINY